MKQDIVVRDALGLPGLVQGILGNPFAVKRLTSDCLYTSRNNYLCIHIGSKTVLKCLPSNIGKALRQFKNRILVTTTGHADIPKSFAPVKYRTGRG